MQQQTIIAIDVGRSAVKVKAFAEGKTYDIVFPSVTSPAVRLSDEASAAAAEKDTVKVDDRKFFVGETARLQGGVQTAAGLTADWIETVEYRALLLSAMKRLADQRVPGLVDASIVVGTPAAHYLNQRAKLEDVTQKTIPGTVKALSQPMGAFLAYFLADTGIPIPDRVQDEEKRIRSYAVIDVGYFSTDFLLMREGVHVESKSSSCEGIYVAAEKLSRILADNKNIKVTQLECEQALRTRKIRHFGAKDVTKEVAEAAEEVVSKIVPKAVTLFADEVASLDAVIIAGGGASVVFDSIHRKWPNAILLPDPRMAVAEGFLRFGKGLQLKRAYAAGAPKVMAHG